jgi:hypothetical protein
MGIQGEGGGGRSNTARGQVSQGRYSKMREGRFSGNRWSVLDVEDEGNEGRKEKDTDRGTTRENRQSVNMDAEEIVEVEVERSRDTQEKVNGSGEGGRKRNLEERSPGAHDSQRVNRRKVNEFEMGRMFEEIVKKMGADIDSLIERAPDTFKRELKEGLEIMMNGMKGIMNGVSDRVATERMAREAEELRTEDKMEKLMEEVKEIKNVNNGMVNDRMEQKVRASEREMEEKVKGACCNLKILDIDFREVTEDRAKMVRTVIGGFEGGRLPGG